MSVEMEGGALIIHAGWLSGDLEMAGRPGNEMSRAEVIIPVPEARRA